MATKKSATQKEPAKTAKAKDLAPKKSATSKVKGGVRKAGEKPLE